MTGIWPEQRAQHTGWMVQNTRLFELFSCPIAQFTVVTMPLPVFGGYLNLLIIAGSGVLNISESENYLFPFVEKNQNKRTANSVISNTPKK